MYLKLTDDVKAKQKIGKRFYLIRKSLGMKQKEMATIFGLTQTCIAHFEKGTVLPNTGHLALLSRKFNIDLNWLMWGQGTMLKRSDQINKLYKDLKENYQVPEVAMVLDAKLQETKKLFSNEIAEFFMAKCDD